MEAIFVKNLSVPIYYAAVQKGVLGVKTTAHMIKKMKILLKK